MSVKCECDREEAERDLAGVEELQQHPDDEGGVMREAQHRLLLRPLLGGFEIPNAKTNAKYQILDTSTEERPDVSLILF
jgi:hypothetical protein